MQLNAPESCFLSWLFRSLLLCSWVPPPTFPQEMSVSPMNSLLPNSMANYHWSYLTRPIDSIWDDGSLLVFKYFLYFQNNTLLVFLLSCGHSLSIHFAIFSSFSFPLHSKVLWGQSLGLISLLIFIHSGDLIHSKGLSIICTRMTFQTYKSRLHLLTPQWNTQSSIYRHPWDI